MRQFSELCDCINDQCAPASSGASVYVGLEHIDSGAFFLKRHGSPSEVLSSKSRFRKGDILYGKLRPYLDKAVLAQTDGICSTDILVFRAKPKVRAAYLLGLIHTQDFLDHSAQTTNGVNHPRTSWPGLSPFRWNVPDESEQEKIAAVLWKIQRAIEVEEKLTASGRELKQAAMHKVFEHGLTNAKKRLTEAGLVPENWTITQFDDFVTLQRGQDLPRANFAAGNIPVIGATRIIGYHDSSNVSGPGVTVVRSGSSAGKPLYIESDFWAHNVVLYVKDFHGNLPLFAYYKLLNMELQQFRSGVAVPTLNRNAFSSEMIAVPPIDEQVAIANVLQAIDHKIALHERKAAALQDLFKTTLHQLMSGETRVADLEIDTSEVTA